VKRRRGKVVEGEEGAAAEPLGEGHWHLDVVVVVVGVVVMGMVMVMVSVVHGVGLGEEVLESHHLVVVVVVVVEGLLLALAAVAGHDLLPHVIDGFRGCGGGDGDEVGGGELRGGRRGSF